MKDSSKYIAPDGSVYASYQDYCNAPDLDLDLVQVKLWNGQRTPQNDFERRLLKEIQAASEQGRYLEIYPN